MLTITDQIPPGLLEAAPTELVEVLGGPTLIHLSGRHSAPLFVSALQHGNEDVGLRAIQKVLKSFIDSRPLPRALSIFIANVHAAQYGVRRLAHQPDYNRAWPGGEPGNTPEHRMMTQVTDDMKQRGVFASIDLHNNVGLNPHYACINRLDATFLQLATLFGRTVVYFVQPRGVQSMAFAELCPSVTLECGKVGNQLGVEHATEFISAALHLDHMPGHPVTASDIDLFHTVAVVKVPADVSLGVGECEEDLCLLEELERLNFRELAPGTPLARRGSSGRGRLLVEDEQAQDVTDRYVTHKDGFIQLERRVMPSMLTTNEEAIRQDCLCYFMERYHTDAIASRHNG